MQHYTNQLAKETGNYTKELNKIPLPSNPSEMVWVQFNYCFLPIIILCFWLIYSIMFFCLIWLVKRNFFFVFFVVVSFVFLYLIALFCVLIIAIMLYVNIVIF